MSNCIIRNFAIVTQSFLVELKLLFKDKAALFSYVGSILIVAFFYSYVYHNETFYDLPIAVVDLDQSQMSRKMETMIDATSQLSVAYKTTNYADAKRLIEEEAIKGIVVIPKDFGRDIQLGKVPSVISYSDASYFLYYKNTLEAIMSSVGTLGGQVEVNKIMSSGTPMKEAVATRRPLNVVATPLFNLNSGYGTFLMPVVFIIAIQILQITAMGVITGTLREKKTFNQVYLFAKGRGSSISLTIGRSIAYLLVSTILMLIMTYVVTKVYDFPLRGQFIDTFVFLIPVLLSITFLGMAVSILFTRREDALMLITVFSIPSLMITGISWPTIAFPQFLKAVSMFIPSTIGSTGYVAISQFGASLFEVQEMFIKMWLLCGFYFLIAVWVNYRLAQENKKEHESQ